MTLTERFLRAKHWQIFLLIIGLPIFFQIVFMLNLFWNMGGEDPADSFGYLAFFPLMMVLCAGVFFFWFWSIAIGLQSKIPVDAKMKTGRFKFFFFFPLCYILLLVIAMAAVLPGMVENINGGQPDVGFVLGIVGIIVPLHLFCIFCIFYCLYFVSKTIRTAELQQATTFSDFAGEFFLIWFYPIGIWIVQPRINKLVMEGGVSTPSYDGSVIDR